ncbi:hypothetical protein ACVIHI_009041 [Bradyrhizobium sp. USDA 4524]|uniref:hypothetical protein n=1 Tax=unclassified Bradyrhizobium TaxID=2631580 RepID=UPI00209CDA4D|nr:MULTISPECIES: hypothetical protein [unclassified Bradyrhizobium]MCP1845492.1 hypothetical protein [Bradyrhizobium sp. USDA 4538]MCP1907186.1 hypothetical protein [Bradyrhizobium sp. USDA 4537]MCP1985662.1 hypothetical protein [Bradyrhizobium sp. USDA 4539]
MSLILTDDTELNAVGDVTTSKYSLAFVMLLAFVADRRFCLHGAPQGDDHCRLQGIALQF